MGDHSVLDPQRDLPAYEEVWRWDTTGEPWTADDRMLGDIADEYAVLRLPPGARMPPGHVMLWGRYGDRWIFGETDRRTAYEAGYRQGWRNGRCDRDMGEDDIGDDPGDSYAIWLDESAGIPFGEEVTGG